MKLDTYMIIMETLHLSFKVLLYILFYTDKDTFLSRYLKRLTSVDCGWTLDCCYTCGVFLCAARVC